MKRRAVARSLPLEQMGFTTTPLGPFAWAKLGSGIMNPLLELGLKFLDGLEHHRIVRIEF